MLHYHDAETITEITAPINTVYCEGARFLLSEHPVVLLFKEYRDHGTATNPRYMQAARFPFQTRRIFSAEEIEERACDLRDRRIEMFDNFRVEEARGTGAAVKINADGRIELLDAHHRSSALMVKGDKTLKCNVKYVSPLWQRMSDDLHSILGRKFLYSPIEHPWFDDWDVCRSAASQRNKMITDALEGIKPSIPSRILYEVGCCTGHFLRHASRHGWGCSGLDNSENFIRIADQLNFAFGTEINYYHNCDFQKLIKEDACKSTAVIVCLSVLHHWLVDGKGDERYRQAVEDIAESSWAFVIDIEPDGKFLQQAKTAVPLERAKYAAWLRDVIGCTKIKYLGTPDMGRPIFLCSKRI